MKYTEEELMSFGEYLLSEERTEIIEATHPELTAYQLKEIMARVHQSDFDKWKELKSIDL